MYDSKDLGNLSDRELLAESRAYEAKITSDAAGLNFTNTEVQAMKTVNDAFESTLDAWDALQIQEAGISQQKAAGRQNVLGELRGQRKAAYADRSLTDEALASKGIPPRDKIKTDAPAPSSVPTAWIDTLRLKHVIHFRDVNTPDTTAKPEGVRSCEIYRYIGASPPSSVADFDFVADDTNTPYTCNYDIGDVGKKAVYMLRWRSKGDEVGTWSATIEATVNG